MSSTDLSGALWRKSSYSNGQANCVEVTTVPGGRTFAAYYDSKAPDAPSLMSRHEHGGSSLAASEPRERIS